MPERKDARVSVRFGPFEVSSESGELRKHGRRLRLSGQAIQLLLTLLETPGRVVPCEELQRTLWPEASFGDFDHGLNAAVNRLREVLGDSASEPKFIETVPRRGYRFIGEIEPEQLLSQPASRAGVPQKERLHGLGRVWKFGLSGSAALLAVYCGAYFLQRPAATPALVTVVPFTSYDGVEMSPTFSPDGSQIAFGWYRGWGASTAVDLFVKQIGNERAVRLTNHEATALVPAWSPDGQTIAYAMTGKSGSGVYVLPSLGGRERLLARLSDNYWQYLVLSWSADSRLLAVASDASTTKVNGTPGHFRIHVIDVATGEERMVPEPSPDCLIVMEPAFSPDGKYLASACVLNEGVNKIYVQRPDGGGPKEVAIVNARALQGLAWTPDNESLIYGGRNGLWRVAVTGGPPERLAFAPDAMTPAVARAGNRLAYAKVTMHRDIWRVDLAAPTRAAGPPSKIISSSLGQQSPSISPDGAHVAFQSGRSGNREIWVSDRDGSNPVQLSFLGGPETERPRWSPDGRRIVFYSTAQGELYVVNAYGGGPPHKLATPLTARDPVWSMDGRWIYFGTWKPHVIWKIPAEGGTAVRVSKEGPYDPRPSLDGKRVYYLLGGELNHAEGTELWSMAVDGGDDRREPGMPRLKMDASWTPGQNGIYFTDSTGSHFYLFYLDLATRRVHQVSDLPGISFLRGGIAVSPNNDAILFTGIDRGESDIMLAESFH